MTRVNGHAPKRRRHQHDHDRICPWCSGSGSLPQPFPSTRRTLCWCCKGDGFVTRTFQPLT